MADQRVLPDVDDSAPTRVGLVVGTWLPASETFVYDQVSHSRKTRLFVCARRRIEGSETRFPYDEVCTLTPFQELRFKWTRRAPTFVGYLQRNRVELIHAHFGTNGAHVLDIADELRVPLVVSFHGHDVAGLAPQNRYHRRYFQLQMLKARLWQRSSLLICASEDLARRLVEQHGAPPRKVVVHALGVNVERFAYLDRSRPGTMVLSVGRLVEKKGLLYGIRAFARVLEILPSARYRIVGEGPLREELEREAGRLGVADKVEFLGAMSHDAVASQMAQADVLLCPSVTGRDGDLESGVLVLKEAAATGLPAVGSRHGGIPEIIDHGLTGYLAEERDEAALAQHLVRTLSDDGHRVELGRAGARKVRSEFDAVTQNARLESLLLSCLSPKSPPR